MPNSYSIDSNGKRKKELWELNKTPYQRFKINARIAWRRFDIQTRGMGLCLLCILGMMLVLTLLPPLVNYIFGNYEKKQQVEIIIGNCDIGARCYKYA